jgi:hypothetical protein
MCFSAPASFIAATVLTGVGIAALRLTSHRSEWPFAAIPLLFGVQQGIEGVIWLVLGDGGTTIEGGWSMGYSLFSHVLWPIFVPLAVGLLEPYGWRQRAIWGTQMVGLAVGGYLFYNLIRFPIVVHVLGQHLVYDSPHFYIAPVMSGYLIATCASSLLSSHHMIRCFGAASLGTFFLAYAIHAATLISMWCFFAAILSVIVYLHFRGARRTLRTDSPTLP